LEKFFGKSLEESLETLVNSKGACFFGHNMSDSKPSKLFQTLWKIPNSLEKRLEKNGSLPDQK
jgi:hypothetical protein